jgi:hypothetical protein
VPVFAHNQAYLGTIREIIFEQIRTLQSIEQGLPVETPSTEMDMPVPSHLDSPDRATADLYNVGNMSSYISDGNPIPT